MINENPQTATNKEKEMECNCEHWQQCATCKPKALEKTPHKHAKMMNQAYVAAKRIHHEGCTV